MEILIKSQRFKIKEIGSFGREGEIYSIDGSSGLKLVKIYDIEKRTAYVQRKVTAFINKMKQINLGGVENFIAYPELPVYDPKTRGFCGFLMKNFSNHSNLFKNKYDLNLETFKNENINDETARAIIISLFAYLEVIHKAGFLLGDINPDNILIDKETFMPAIVDFDSAQMGTFYSNTHQQAYIDPTVRIDGYGRNKHFIYTIDSDIFALAVVCYEFIIGTHPYFFQTTIPTDTEFKKANALSFIDYFENNNTKIEKFEFAAFQNLAYKAFKERLTELQSKYSDLYEFFKSVFSEGKRNYYAVSSGKRYSVGMTGVVDDSASAVLDLIPQSKEDPEELEMFIKQFNLRVN